MSKIVMAVFALLVSRWCSQCCWEEEFSEMTRWKKIKYIITDIVFTVFLYVSWSNISKISFHMRVVNTGISIFIAILLMLGNIPVKIGFKGFKSGKEFIEFYLEDIIFCILTSILVFSLLTNLTIGVNL